MARTLFSVLSICLFASNFVGCGGEQSKRQPREDDDTGLELEERSQMLDGTVAVDGKALDGTHWKWVEAHCTEGPLDLASKGFSQHLAIEREGDALNLFYTQQFESTGCKETVVQRATPAKTALAEHKMTEEVRVIQPDSGCSGTGEADRPGDVRKRGDFLEVFVQRSMWCGGFEVRMVYAPTEPIDYDDDQLIRAYFVRLNLLDAGKVATLYAAEGAVVDPYTVTETGNATRYDGRVAVAEWYKEQFDASAWMAFRLTEIEKADNAKYAAKFEYMDPRLKEPSTGAVALTLAGGEVYESKLELTVPTKEGTNKTPAKKSATKKK